MKNLSSPFAKFVAIAACALTLGSCNRAEYAMLPKGSSYHGVSRASTPVSAAPAPTEAAPVTAEPTTAAVSEAPAAEKVASASVATAAPAAEPVAKAAQPAAVASASTSTTVVAARKLNPVQRLALNKMTRKVNKLVQKTSTARSHDNTASTARGGIDGNLRTGLILLLVGLLVGILSYIVGTIIAIVGLVFIILWLLDQA